MPAESSFVWNGSGAFRGTNRFQLLRLLGRGGMGVVYEALDRASGMHVALKLLPLLQPELLLRFKNEFRALTDIHHRNLVRLGELFCEGEQWFFTMELVLGAPLLSYVAGASPEPNLDDLPLVASPCDDVAVGPPLWGGVTESLRRIARSPEAPTVRLPARAVPPLAVPAPPSRGFDEERLRRSFAELAEGVGALHGAGKVHRDIKPSNVLVTKERVVVLDFGLVSDALADHQTLVGIGTPAYMAPEQITAQTLGPEADWYSVGVMLFEGLTGRLPFDGAAHEILYRKQREPAPAVEGPAGRPLPPDLVALCSELLRTDPAARPPEREILERFGAGGPSRRAVRLPSRVPEALLGRDRELAALGDALTDAAKGDGRAVVVLVRGASGVGKTVLVRHFTQQLQTRVAATVLAGRCYEREFLPYKAFDGVVDALAQLLIRMPPAEVDALLPDRAALLLRVFPVLGRVGALGAAGPLADLPPDPQELRARVFGTMRELFARLAARGPLVLAVDDLHWADSESLALIGDILRGPAAPAVLLLATVRSDLDAGDAGIARALAEPRLDPVRGKVATFSGAHPPDVRSLEVGNLAPDDALALARSLVSSTGAEAAPDPTAIAREAEGHPLLIRELVLAEAGGFLGSGPVRLDEVLARRIAALSEPARLVVELLASAGVPLPQSVLADAAAMEPAVLSQQVAALRSAHLLRTRGPRWGDAVEVYHDRIRHAVWSRLDEDVRRGHLLRLARVLEGRSEPARLAELWREAGEPQKAAQYAAQAGDEAVSALAFDRAVAHFRQALALGRWEEAERRGLRVKLAEAVSKAGQGAAAGRLFLEAAAEGAPSAEALVLQRRGAEELLRSGHVDEGLAAVRGALSATGMELPPTPRRALLALLTERAKLRLRGLRFRARDESEVAASDLGRIDLCWSLSSGLGLTDHLSGACFQVRSLRLALDAGEPARVARGLAGEAAFVSTLGSRGESRALALLGQARALAQRLEQPHALAFVSLMSGIQAHMVGAFARGREALEDADRVLRNHGNGDAWELDAARQFRLECEFYMGDLRAFRRSVLEGLEEAEARGNLYASTNLRVGRANFVWLMDDDPVRARAEADQALAGWSHRGFHVQHWYDLCARAYIDLYEGRGQIALGRLAESWQALLGSHLLRIQHTRIVAYSLAGRAWVQAAMVTEGRERKKALARVRHASRRLAREPVAWADGFARLLAAAAAHLGGNSERACAHLSAAGTLFAQLEMGLYERVTRLALATASGDNAGIERELLQLRALGLRAPLRVLRLLVPGFVPQVPGASAGGGSTPRAPGPVA